MDEEPKDLIVLGAIKHGVKKFDKIQKMTKIEPDELKLMVEGIRATELIMGDGLKLPQASEIPYLSIARRSLVANKAIKKGELFTPENLTTKRPANGLSPNQYWSLLNTISSKDYAEGDMIVMYSNS